MLNVALCLEGELLFVCRLELFTQGPHHADLVAASLWEKEHWECSVTHQGYVR